MGHPKSISHESYPDTHHDVYSKTIFGFWLYLLTDFILFATLFATYAVLRHSTYGGPSAKELFDLPLTLIQTLILLVSGLTIGCSGAFAHRRDKNKTVAFLGLTFLLGIVFMGIQLTDFARLVGEGSSWQRSAFLSAFFTLVATFWLHVIFAILWIVVLTLPIWRYGLTSVSVKRITCLRMFWQFLNVVWIFVFTVVYLMGRIGS